jgi:hypothetical protein
VASLPGGRRRLGPVPQECGQHKREDGRRLPGSRDTGTAGRFPAAAAVLQYAVAQLDSSEPVRERQERRCPSTIARTSRPRLAAAHNPGLTPRVPAVHTLVRRLPPSHPRPSGPDQSQDRIARSTRRVSSHSVATAPGALYRSSRAVTGVVIGEPLSDWPLKARLRCPAKPALSRRAGTPEVIAAPRMMRHRVGGPACNVHQVVVQQVVHAGHAGQERIGEGVAEALGITAAEVALSGCSVAVDAPQFARP